MATDKNNLLEGSIARHMVRLALPSIGGMVGFVIFNITDTYFVSALGTNALAAMGYTFPVVLIIGAVSSGISAGASSRLSRAKGAGDHHLMQRIATDGILLSLLGVFIFATIGLLTMDPLFRALGANEETLPLVKQYMTIWYAMVVVVLTPPVCDSCMRASGDMFRPFIVMTIAAGVNTILDPLLIHGYWIFPKMGIRGAALATVIARSMAMVATLFFASHHHHLLNFKYKSASELFSSWKSILSLGVPSIATQLMPQVLRTVITSLAAAAGGTAAVAALAAGTRIESFPNIVSFGIGLSLIPIIGQNWGARQYQRAFKAKKYALGFAVAYGLFMFSLSLFFSKSVVRIFTGDAEVIRYSSYYLWIVLFSSAGFHITNWMSTAFTTIGRPRFTFLINVVGIGIIVIPLTILGNHLYGFVGMLFGLSIGQIIMGVCSVLLSRRYMQPSSMLL